MFVQVDRNTGKIATVRQNKQINIQSKSGWSTHIPIKDVEHSLPKVSELESGEEV